MNTHSTARDWQTRARLAAAAVLGFFQLLTLAVYIAGLGGPEVMRAVLAAEGPILVFFPLFTQALIVHACLGLHKLYRRNTLVMPAWEVTQIVLGLSLPLFLVSTNAALSLMDLKFGLPPSDFERLALSYPELMVRIVLMTLVIGAHAYIGTHALLRVRPWYPRLRVALLVTFVLLPILAVVGYLNASSQAQPLPPPLSPDQLEFVRWTDLGVSCLILSIYGFLFLGRALRLRSQAKNQTVKVLYPDGQEVAVIPQTTILEASRIGGRPHASICGGRGRCTTCRVRVEAGMDHLSPVGDREQKALNRIGADASIRLACQAEGLGGPVTVVPLLRADLTTDAARRETKDSVGRDVELCVLFADLRGFTALSERKFPYDVVFILNNFYHAMGTAIEEAGGTIDKFLGDGVLAYFGLDQDPRQACSQALQACQKMAADLGRVNHELVHVLPEGLALGLGLHFGDAILGEMGFGRLKHLTVIGDTVNTASRLEGLCKDLQCQLVVSTGVAARAGVDLSHLPVQTVSPRGREDGLRVYAVPDILKDLPPGLVIR